MAGLEPLGKPTKKTVMLGARLYIEYLETEQRVQAVRLGRAEEALRGRMQGEEWARWKIETEHQASRCAAEYAALLEDKAKVRAAAGESGGDGGDPEEEEEEEVRPKKRARAEPAEKKPRQAAGARKPRTSVTSTTSHSSGTTAATTAFYSFGLAYVLFPRATEWLGYRSQESAAAATTGNATAGKVLLPLTSVIPPNNWISPAVFGVIGYLVFGLVIMACVYLFSRGREQEEGEEESDEVDGAERVGLRRLARKVGLGTVNGLLKELVYRIPLLREESTSPATAAAWYKLHSAHVGGGE
jgi:hypothetical protein